jgi:hypothetical protein
MRSRLLILSACSASPTAKAHEAFATARDFVFPHGEDEMANSIRSAPVRLLRRRPQPDSLRLPHPSWRLALGNAPGGEDQRLASASEFWARLGL